MTADTPTFVAAIELFNEGRYLASHELFDELWEATEGPDADFYKGLIQAAIALHHYYCAVESCLERIVRTFEGMVSEGPDWHRELLHVATLEIPQVRPPVLRADTEAALSHLLRFRHFLRHAYSAKLQMDRMRELAELLVHASVEVDRDLTDFRDYLLRCQAALSSP